MSYKDTDSYKQMIRNNKLMLKIDRERETSRLKHLKNKGWEGESERHRMARYGIKTKGISNKKMKLYKAHVIAKDYLPYQMTHYEPAQKWNVYLNGKKIDSVFYDAHLDKDWVLDGLINHDGYDSNIVVRKGK